MPLLQIVRHLRNSLDSDQAADVLEMAELQIVAAKKFPSADRMLFTRQGLEQSTGHVVARFRAGLIPTDRRIVDACCGIGGDLIALAEHHNVVGIEIDPLLADIASHNLQACNRRGNVVCESFSKFAFQDSDFLFVDPDRRGNGRRTTRTEQLQPDWQTVCERIGQRSAAVKLAPATQLDSSDSGKIHRQWIGYDRECREQVAWFRPENLCGNELSAGMKSAWVLDENGRSEAIFSDPAACGRTTHSTASSPPGPASPTMDSESRQAWPSMGELNSKGWLYDPHSVVFAAGLTVELSKKLNAVAFTYDSPYLTGEELVRTRLAQAFQILESGQLDRKRLLAVLRKHDVGAVEWKQRGVEKSVFASFGRIQGKGSQARTVVLYRSGRSLSFCLCCRI